MYPKTPTWKEWIAENRSTADAGTLAFPVQRILKPMRYPSWTFLTEPFRLSLLMPENFGQIISYHSEKQSLICCAVIVEDLKATLSFELWESVKDNDRCDWQTLSEYEKWVALDAFETPKAQSQSDAVNSIAAPSIDFASLQKLAPPQGSLRRQEGARRAKKGTEK